MGQGASDDAQFPDSDDPRITVDEEYRAVDVLRAGYRAKVYFNHHGDLTLLLWRDYSKRTERAFAAMVDAPVHDNGTTGWAFSMNSESQLDVDDLTHTEAHELLTLLHVLITRRGDDESLLILERVVAQALLVAPATPGNPSHWRFPQDMRSCAGLCMRKNVAYMCSGCNVQQYCGNAWCQQLDWNYAGHAKLCATMRLRK